VFSLDVVVEGDFVDESLLAAVLTMIQYRSCGTGLPMKLKIERDVIE